MIFAVDVYYRETQAIVAGVLFQDWEDSQPIRKCVVQVEGVAEYEPGQFYKRELPCILQQFQIQP